MITVLVVVGAVIFMIAVVAVVAADSRHVDEEEDEVVAQESVGEMLRHTAHPPETLEEKIEREEDEAYYSK